MDKETAKIAKAFSKNLKKHLGVEKVVLFGSRARGDNFKRSDYDFLIVSEKFANIPFVIRMSKIYDYWSESVDVEAICYTPEEFARKVKEKNIVRTAVEEGVEL